MVVPSEDKETETPDESIAASPSMSSPSLVQVDPFQLYTLTWPAKDAVSSFPYAPIATVVPSEDKETEIPE